jgi:hypothetical protein
MQFVTTAALTLGIYWALMAVYQWLGARGPIPGLDVAANEFVPVILALAVIAMCWA